ncbi:hypothetical protein [Vibrio splendidus]|uniref:hypothetical protein n=1 Tax=Vibrio splendidus TaxID=29497 RepID=UPI003D138114
MRLTKYYLLLFIFYLPIVQAATYTVTSSLKQGSGSLRYLIEKANNNPGEDTIEIPAQYSPIYPGLGPSNSSRDNHMVITDDLIIRGLGNTQVIIDDHQRWMSTGGLLNVGYPSDAGNTILKPSGLLFRVNPQNQAGKTVNVTLENIRVQNMSSFLSSNNADIILNKVLVNNIVPNHGSSSTISSNVGSFTIIDSLFYENLGPRSAPTFLFIGELNIIGSRFSSNGSSFINSFTHTIQTLGDGVGQSTVSIRDSIFQDLLNSSFYFQRADIEISNTLINGASANTGVPVYIDEGNLVLTNSTLYFPQLTSNSDSSLKATHIELRRGSQLAANNSLLIVM